MIAWYQTLPDGSTSYTDAQIAEALDRIDSTQGWVHGGALFGNAALVRSVRRWIDKQRSGEFADYAFGTRRAGRGQTWTHLRTGLARLDSAKQGTAAQYEASEMYERRMFEERARIAMKYNAESEEFFQLQLFQQSMACRDAANDIDQHGYLRPTTKSALVRLGLTVITP